MGIIAKAKKAWNAFVNTDTPENSSYVGPVTYSTTSPSRTPIRYSSERSIISSIYTRISVDVSAITFRHTKLDEFGRYLEDKDSQLNKCLTLEANLDQGPRAFRQDIVQTLFDKGAAAIVPVDTIRDAETNDILDILTVRVGEICEYQPKHVKVSAWNENTGKRETIRLEKRTTAIIENPLYSIMNEPNSILQRLIRKLSLLDAVDEASSSGKLDLIIQLPYVVKSESVKARAEQRRTDIELQLKESKYGIAYIDGTEKVTQLNRPAESNLLKQVEFLSTWLYEQLGITKEVMAGTADEATMINYFHRSVKPVLDAIREAMQRSFLGIKGTMNQEKISYFRDPFDLVPVSELAQVADVLSRNEIITPNEFRGIIGFEPSQEPKADLLQNSNMPNGSTGAPAAPAGPSFEDMDKIMNEVFDGLGKDIDKIAKNASDG